MKAYRTSWEAPMGNGQGTVSQDYGTLELGNDSMLRGGRYGNTVDGNTYFASAFLPGNQQYIPTFEGGLNTPIGRLGLETNYDTPNTIEANYQPNAQANYYLQALANLLSRGR